GQGDAPEPPRAAPLADPLDRPSLPGGVPALEHDADLGPGRLDPFLHGDELAVQQPHLALVLLALHLRGRAGFGPLPRLGGPRRDGHVVLPVLLLGHVAYLRREPGDLSTPREGARTNHPTQGEAVVTGDRQPSQ